MNVSVKPCDYAAEYTQISALIDSADLSGSEEYNITVKDQSGTEKTFEAFSYKSEDGEGCLAYLPSESFPADSSYEIKLMVKNKDGFFELRS